MTAGKFRYAERRAHNILDAWLKTTGLVELHTSYYYELQGVISDAVRCGAQAADGVEETLSSEMGVVLDESFPTVEQHDGPTPGEA